MVVFSVMLVISPFESHCPPEISGNVSAGSSVGFRDCVSPALIHGLMDVPVIVIVGASSVSLMFTSYLYSVLEFVSKSKFVT